VNLLVSLIVKIEECSVKLIFRKQHPVQTCIAPFDRFRKDGQTLRPEQANEISDGSETKEDRNDILNR